MKTVNEVSQITGVSVRTLHYYDEIGLLKPTAVSDSGYRYYDDDAIERLHGILLFRELEFPLRDIKRIMDDPGYDSRAALDDRIRLLELKRDRISQMIASARDLRDKGMITMNNSNSDRNAVDEFAAEAKKRWGGTAEYREYEKKCKTSEEAKADGDGLMNIFGEFGKIRELSPDSDAAQSLVAKLQSFISEKYYSCNKTVLRSLGEMYTSDPRFKNNIDAKGGEGTAELASRAITVYCDK